MRSKLAPWEFVKVYPHLVNEEHTGILAFYSFDPYIEAFYLKRLRDFFRSKERELFIVLGSELTRNWAEENFGQVGLFSSQESYLVLCAEDMSEDVRKYLCESELSLDQRSLILSSWKSGEWIEKFSKKSKCDVLKIQAPAFWENEKLLEYISYEMDCPISFQIKNYLIEALGSEAGEYVEALKLLSLHMPKQGEIELSTVRELIRPEHLDRFELAASFAQKKKGFFKKLLELELPEKELIEFFRFMQGHLLKMLDPSYADNKKRLTKYDKSLMAHAKLWKPDQLKKAIHHFSELELMAKRKERSLKEKMRQSYLAHFL